MRYILRCNPIRKEEIAKNRESKFDSIKEFADERTKYLCDHPAQMLPKRLKKLTPKSKNRPLKSGCAPIALHQQLL